MHWPRDQKVRGEGRTVTKTVTVARLLVTRAATAVCCCCRRVSVCRYDCLCSLVILLLLAIVISLPLANLARNLTCPKYKRLSLVN